MSKKLEVGTLGAMREYFAIMRSMIQTESDIMAEDVARAKAIADITSKLDRLIAGRI